MLRWKLKLAIVAAVMGVATWAGYRSERRTMDAAGKPATTIRSVVRRVMAPKSRTESIDKLNALRHVAGRSEPTPREMQQCWEIIRGFTVEDVQAYLAEIPDGLNRPANSALVSMLFYRWAQMDPEGAMSAGMQPPYATSRTMPYMVVVPWVERDMEGAMRWAKANGSDSEKMIIGNEVGRMLAKQDPENALARAKAEFPEAVNAVLLELTELTEQMSGSKESRQKLFGILAGLDDPQIKRRCLYELRWSYDEGDQEQALAAVKEMEESGLFPEQVEIFRREVSYQVMREKPQERMEWMMSAESKASTDAQVGAYTNWVQSKPEEAIAWAAEHDKIDFLAETVKKMTYSQIRAGWVPTDDSRGRWENTTHRQFNAWREHQPEAAEAWLGTLPTEMQEVFNAPLSNNGTK
ncbi:hypothetical protein [Luteolibacter soli]|uniref:HEAT repeat domain-containing protein n=1 Tax=Luteolibacter soli TaxID=3135280 RepID=A0ABU9AWP6_9BACT